MELSRNNLAKIAQKKSHSIEDAIFHLPEKILQFGTGVLLRALPDYFIDKANRQNIFNGRILVVKSTSSGDIKLFERQDGLYTLAIRGIENGKVVDESVISSAISRVLSAADQWDEILAAAASPDMTIVISNTTEVGIQLVEESIFKNPPASFPAKLLAFLYQRFIAFKGLPEAGLIIIPTELLTDNGKKLKSVISRLAVYNQLDSAFLQWMNDHNQFCNSLVDRIVPGFPDPEMREDFEKTWGYSDSLMSVCEPYRLWVIEGGDELKKKISFYSADKGVVITEDITRYKELKLRMLNATHSLSCGLAFLSGFKTVKSAMEDGLFESFVENLMMDEICPAIPYSIPGEEKRTFGLNVLDRFRNPYLQHQWLSITMQYSSKMMMRVLPVLNKYYELFNKPPEYISIGFAAYILFMRPVKKQSDKYFGMLNNQLYLINDDQAAEFFGIWEERVTEEIVAKVLSNNVLWGMDLTLLDGFAQSVSEKLKGFIHSGTLNVISACSGLNR